MYFQTNAPCFTGCSQCSISRLKFMEHIQEQCQTHKAVPVHLYYFIQDFKYSLPTDFKLSSFRPSSVNNYNLVQTAWRATLPIQIGELLVCGPSQIQLTYFYIN